MKKKLISSFLSVSLILGIGVSTNKIEATTSLKDLKGHWAEMTVKTAVEKGIITGYSDGTFKPDNSITRIELITMLAKAVEKDYSQINVSFSDIPSTYWGLNHIKEAIAVGIIVPSELGGKLNPNEKLTRLEMATMIARALQVNSDYQALLTQYKGLIPMDIPFTDWKKVEQKDVPSIAMTVGTGITNGVGNGSFGMSKTTTRGEAATMISRFLQAVVKAPSDYRALVEFQEVALTGTNATTVSSLKPMQDHYANLKITDTTFNFTTKRVYILPLHAKESVFMSKFVGDKNELFKENSNYADPKKIEAVVATVGDMEFKTDGVYFSVYANKFSVAGFTAFVMGTPMDKYGLEYGRLGYNKVQLGSKGENKEMVMYGTYGIETIGLDMQVSSPYQSISLFFNPNHNQ